MAINEGQINRSGIGFLLISPTEPLPVQPDAPIKWLHFVDSAGTTIVPTYQPDAFQSFGGPIAGAKVQVAGAEEFAALSASIGTVSAAPVANTVAKRNADAELLASSFRGDIRAPGPAELSIKTADNSPVITIGQNLSGVTLSFNGEVGQTLPIPVSIAGGVTAVREALVALGLFVEIA